MVVAPSGRFMMGSPASEANRNINEGPVHRVAIERPFAVGVYAVTRREFARFVEATERSMGNACSERDATPREEPSGRHWKSPGFSQDDDHPVVWVSWEDAQAYVRWLSRETGAEYRLLSEAEWEYVARAGTTGPFHWGATITQGQAHYDRRYSYPCISKDESYDQSVLQYLEHTLPVDWFGPNAFGLYNVHGNVLEWVEDCWNESYHGAPVDGSAWTSGDCAKRVLRGGSWYAPPRLLRSAARIGLDTRFRCDHLGFRVARTLPP